MIRVCVATEEGSEDFGQAADVKSALPHLMHAISHAEQDFQLDGKMREVCLVIGEPSVQEPHITCLNTECRASGADITLFEDEGDDDATDAFAVCTRCGRTFEVTREEYDRHQAQLARAAEHAHSHAH